jgi:hypothetical protein
MAYVVFILCVLLNSLAFADEWELARHDNQRQIQVYVSSQNNSSYHQFKAQTIVEQPIGTVLAVLSDINAWPQWLARIKLVNVLKKQKDHSLVYVIYKLPYPFLERDMVLYNRVQHLNTGAILIKAQAQTNYRLPSDIVTKRIRLTNFSSTWRLTTLATGKTLIELWGQGDPEGFVPALVFNYNLPDEPLQSLKQLRKMVLRPQYQKK